MNAKEFSSLIKRITKNIKPSKPGVDDFFSWGLYRWAKKNPRKCRVYKGTWNFITGIDPKHQALYIGKKDLLSSGWFYGAKLMSVHSLSTGLRSYAFGPKHDVARWEDITTEWWESYLQIGVCAIPGDHHSFQEDGDCRTCLNCGRVEKRVVKMVEKVIWDGKA